MANNKPVCVICGKSKAKSNFVKDRNDSLSPGFGFCSECVNSYGVTGNEQDIFDILRMINIPFVRTLWEQIPQEDESKISTYIKMMALQPRYRTFIDSEWEHEEKEDVFQVTDEMKVRWGVKKSLEKYQYLELQLASLKNIKKPATKLEERRYCDAVKMSSRLDEVLANGNAQEISRINKTYNDLIKELGLNVDAKSEDDKRVLGQKIKDWEQEAPVPELGKEFEDVDGIKNYIEKYLLIPFKRSLGIASEEEINKIYE